MTSVLLDLHLQTHCFVLCVCVFVRKIHTVKSFLPSSNVMIPKALYSPPLQTHTRACAKMSWARLRQITVAGQPILSGILAPLISKLQHIIGSW